VKKKVPSLRSTYLFAIKSIQGRVIGYDQIRIDRCEALRI
jgi:hypothetical protein